MRAALMTIRTTGLLGLLVGLAIWAGAPRALVMLHLLLGVVTVAALLVAALGGRRAGAPTPVVAIALVWVVLTPAFGLYQQQLLGGDLRELVRIAHLAIGLVAIGLGEALGASARRGTTRAA